PVRALSAQDVSKLGKRQVVHRVVLVHDHRHDGSCCDLCGTRLCEEHPEGGRQQDREQCATCHCRSPQNVKETFAAKALKPLVPVTSWCRNSASTTTSASMLRLSARVGVGYKVNWPRLKVLGSPGSFPFCQTVSANPDQARREGALAGSEAGISCIDGVCADTRGAAPIKTASTAARGNQPQPATSAARECVRFM